MFLRCIARASSKPFLRSCDRPVWFDSSNTSCTRPWRRSASTSATLTPAVARLTARFDATVVLPSDPRALATNKLNGVCCEVANINSAREDAVRLEHARWPVDDARVRPAARPEFDRYDGIEVTTKPGSRIDASSSELVT